MHRRRQLARHCVGALIVATLAACSTGDRLGDAQVRPADRAECLVGNQRQDLAGTPTLMGGSGCRTDPSNPRPLNKRTE